MAYEVLQGRWFGPVDQLLNQPTPDGRRRRVLDVGTGTGVWVREMASIFPGVDFVGLDVVPVPPPPRRAAAPALLVAPTFLTDDDGSDSDSSSISTSGDETMDQDSENDNEGEDQAMDSDETLYEWREADNVYFVTKDMNHGLVGPEGGIYDVVQCRFVMTLSVSVKHSSKLCMLEL